MHFSGFFFQCSNIQCRCQYYRSLYVIQMPLELLTPTYHAFVMFYWTDDHDNLDDPHNLDNLDDLDYFDNLDEIIPCTR